MNRNKNEIEINGVKYVPKGSASSNAKPVDGMSYVLVRTYSAGVHVGYLKSRDGKEVELRRSRRIWYWKGASCLSQIASEGVSKPEECKFSEETDILLTEAIEVIQVTEKAQLSIAKVAIWKT